MSEQALVVRNTDGLDEVSIAGAKHTETPTFAPEIASAEDLESILLHRSVLDDQAPILVPGYRWQEIRTKPRFREAKREVQSLLQNHPIIYYEPVELFRYRRPKRLVSHALRGKSGKFYSKLRDGDYEDAVEKLPEFFQPFLECQLERLLEIEDLPVPSELEDTVSKATEGWRDKRADEGFESYFAEIAKDAQRTPTTAVVPPVPVVQASSESSVISRVRGSNIGMRTVVDVVNEARFGDQLYSYFHLYADSSILRSSTDNDQELLTMMRQELSEGNYAGVVLTMSNFQTAWHAGLSPRLESFVTDVSNIAMEHRLPFLMPRSGWYGGYLTDQGVHVFSSLLNGNETYTQRGGGMSQAASYGTTPFYGDCLDLPVSEAFDVLQNTGGQTTHIPGLPDRPPTFNASASDWEARLGDDERYRVEFSKARRLLHAEEAREWRESIKSGRTATPAQIYFRNSGHNDLS